jgi:predicted amidohydrolase
MSNLLNIAQIQFSPRLGDIDLNCLKAESFINQCTQSKLIILPELADTGYNFIDKNHALEVGRTLGDNPFIEMLKRQSKKLGLSIVSGFCERTNSKLYNSSILVSKGKVIEKYKKIHLFMNEKDIFDEGKGGLNVIEIDGYKIGMQICFDYLFPEPWRILAEKKVDIIAHPSNLVTFNAFKLIPALCIMNKIFIATTNRVGKERGLSFSGRSFVCDPNGKLINEARDKAEKIIFTSIRIDESRNKMITERNHVFKDRRKENYY